MADREELPQKYCDTLEELKRRLRVVLNFSEGSATLGSAEADLEWTALQLRKALELIAFGSLIANKAAYELAYSDFSKHWSAKRLLQALEKVNRDFYPRPVTYTVVDPGPPRHFHFDYVPDGYLSRGEFVEAYDACSQIIHSQNPFASSCALRLHASQWVLRIDLLLRFHLVRLAGTPELWLAELRAPGDGRAHAYLASPG